MENLNRKWAFIFFVIILMCFCMWRIFAPENSVILINDKGEATKIEKKIYCLFDSDGFYKRQKDIILRRIKEVKQPINQTVTHSDIDLKRIELEMDMGSIDEFDQDYRIPTAEERVARISNDNIAKMIIEDRKKEKTELLQRYETLLMIVRKKRDVLGIFKKEIK